MFAIIQTGGKQYKVTEGQTLDVEKLNRAVGDKVEFDVLLVSDGDNTKTGSPRRKRMTSLFLPEMELRHSDVTTLGPPGRRLLPSGMSGGQTTSRPRLSRAEGALYVFWGTEE